jgi:CPA2 family monovalent cation:H+ antiporter-2
VENGYHSRVTHEPTFLRDILVIFAVAVAVVTVLRKLRVPPIAGFILSGALVGPNALGLVTDVAQVEVLAEVGVVLLLFGLGLELSLDRMRRLWRVILIGGTLQVGLTIAAVAIVATAFGFAGGSAVFLGCVVAGSSTAIVLRGLQARQEIDAPHGRFALGVLLFQDLCVVPMILVIPLLAGVAGTRVSLALTLAKSVGVLVAVLVAAWFVVPRLLYSIAKTQQRDLFVLSVLGVCLGTAWVLSLVGISLALGAFLAGLIVARSEFRHQATADVIPFRQVLTSVFFVSVGMLLDLRAVSHSVGHFMILLLAILIGKFLIVWTTGMIMRFPPRVNILAASSLGQIGEFSFILLNAAAGTALLTADFTRELYVAIILSMLITPIAISLGPHLAAGLGRVQAMTQHLGIRTVEDVPPSFGEMRDHIIIAGYGVAGQELAFSLEDIGAPYVVVDLNADNVRRATQRVMPAYFGDVTSTEVLSRLGAARAKELVIVINDPTATEQAIRAARRAAPNLHILARTSYVADIARLLKAGADEVYAAEQEISVEITARVLDRCGVAPARVETELTRIRSRREE